MNLRKTAVNLVLVASTVALTSAAAASTPEYGIAETVRAMEARYPGKVAAIELDADGDVPAHYHVDMRFPESGMARLNVDASTLAIASRESMERPAARVSLPSAAALVSSAIADGRIVAARLDLENRAPGHYDIDVALPAGVLARLKVDATSGAIAWRTPAIAPQ